jgi:hypothetical protein
MQTYHSPGLPGNGEVSSADTLPLWRWAAAKAAPASSAAIPRAVRRIAAKGRISLPHATVVAELLGLTSEASR